MGDFTHQPAWLKPKQYNYAANLFGSRLQCHNPLVGGQIMSMKSLTPHVAFAGRSNVGKSTLLNMLLHGRSDPLRGKHLSESKKLNLPFFAPVSRTPGRTRHLFRFELGGKLTFVDLPGYGYARAKPEVRAAWATLIDEYLSHTESLERVVSLVDTVVGVKESDEALWEFLRSKDVQIMVVLTKADKVSPEGLDMRMTQVISIVQQLDSTCVWPYIHAVSGLYGHGIQELRVSLSAIASDFQKKNRKVPPSRYH